jgi:hypothetical protein
MARIQFELTDRCAAICALQRRHEARIVGARNIFQRADATAIARTTPRLLK